MPCGMIGSARTAVSVSARSANEYVVKNLELYGILDTLFCARNDLDAGTGIARGI